MARDVQAKKKKGRVGFAFETSHPTATKNVTFEDYVPKTSKSSTSTVASAAWSPTAVDVEAQPLAVRLTQQKGIVA